MRPSVQCYQPSTCDKFTQSLTTEHPQNTGSPPIFMARSREHHLTSKISILKSHSNSLLQSVSFVLLHSTVLCNLETYITVGRQNEYSSFSIHVQFISNTASVPDYTSIRSDNLVTVNNKFKVWKCNCLSLVTIPPFCLKGQLKSKDARTVSRRRLEQATFTVWSQKVTAWGNVLHDSGMCPT